jgi:uncharacterized protein with PQ loop repeat
MNYHDLAVGIGWIAVVLTVWGTFAQFLRVLRQGIEGVSIATWLLFTYMGCFWVCYGFDQRSAVIVLGSAIVLPFQAGVFIRLKPWHSWAVVSRVTLYSFLVCFAPMIFWGWTAGVYGAGVTMVITRGPQLIELIRNPDATGVSVPMWSLSSAALLCWVVYYEDFHLWAAFTSVLVAGIASVAIAVLAQRRHRQSQARLGASVAFVQP